MEPVPYREQWLTELAKKSEKFFVNMKLPPYRLTCGWPLGGALSTKRRVLGQCFDSIVSVGGLHELFITPLLSDPLEVAGVVMHEMAHVAAGVKAGHKGRFIKIIQQVGITKNKPTQALPGDRLNEWLQKILDRLGPYPHTAMKPVTKDKTKDAKALTLECGSCDAKVRMSTKWLESAGAPTCGCGTLFVPKDLKGDPEDK